MNYKGIEIKWLGHAGFLIKNDKVIYIDPFNINCEEKADLILITHSHYDHCSIEDLKKITKPESVILGPADIQSKIGQIGEGVNFRIMEPGRVEELGIKISAVPAYNLGKVFHPKENNWMGYIVEIGGSRIYHAGDTDKIPDMNGIKADICFFPIGGKFTMNADEATEAAEIIRPELVIPMHFGEIIGSEEDAKRFVEKCKKININAFILDRGDF
jgi:L-ascorbate metabolism protein UlaG (beta-lactamase superfamily)